MTSLSPSCRRWFQISLRTLFLLTLIIAAYFGGLATARRQTEKALEAERKARAEVEATLRATEFLNWERARLTERDARRAAARLTLETAQAPRDADSKTVVRQQPTNPAEK